MCLVSKNNKPLIAEDDIVCYKMLVRGNGFFCKWKTPIIGMRVRNGVLSGRRLMKACGERKIIGTRLNDNSIEYEVSGGFIHTYRVSYYKCAGLYMFECVIPKGEEYYKSYDGTEYASRSIRFVSQVF